MQYILLLVYKQNIQDTLVMVDHHLKLKDGKMIGHKDQFAILRHYWFFYWHMDIFKTRLSVLFDEKGQPTMCYPSMMYSHGVMASKWLPIWEPFQKWLQALQFEGS